MMGVVREPLRGLLAGIATPLADEAPWTPTLKNGSFDRVYAPLEAVQMIQIPLSQSGPADQFAAAVQAHIEACTAQMMGQPGKPAPRASEWIEFVVTRQPQPGNPATRGPDKFVALPYRIVDDRPVSPEVQVLRDSINQGA